MEENNFLAQIRERCVTAGATQPGPLEQYMIWEGSRAPIGVEWGGGGGGGGGGGVGGVGGGEY